MDQSGNKTIVDAGAPIVPGTGIVLRYHPITVVVAPDADPPQTAAAAAEVVSELHSQGTFDFGPVATALQGLVVAEQPRGVAAVVDGENPIIFLFDQAVAEGDQQRHQSQGRAGWTTAYATDAKVLLTAGSPAGDPVPVNWSRLTQGTVAGDGALVQLGLPLPEPTDVSATSGQAQAAVSNPATPDHQAAVSPIEVDSASDTSEEIEVLETEIGDPVEEGSAPATTENDTDQAAAANDSVPADAADDKADEVVQALNREDLRRQIAAASTASMATEAAESAETRSTVAAAVIEPTEAADTTGEAVDTDEAADTTGESIDTDEAIDATVTEVLNPTELGLAIDEMPLQPDSAEAGPSADTASLDTGSSDTGSAGSEPLESESPDEATDAGEVVDPNEVVELDEPVNLDDSLDLDEPVDLTDDAIGVPADEPVTDNDAVAARDPKAGSDIEVDSDNDTAAEELTESLLDATPESLDIDLAPPTVEPINSPVSVIVADPPAELSSAPKVTAEPDSAPKVIAGPPPMPGPAVLSDAAAPQVIAGPPPMPDAAPGAVAPQVIAGPPPMPDAAPGAGVDTPTGTGADGVVDVTDQNPATIVLTDPMAAAGPEPVKGTGTEAERVVIAGPPPMPDGPPSPSNA